MENNKQKLIKLVTLGEQKGVLITATASQQVGSMCLPFIFKLGLYVLHVQYGD